MKQLNLGDTIVFPGNQLVVDLNDSNQIVKWGLPDGISSYNKLYAKDSTLKFYRNWKPITIKTGDGFYGGISNFTNMLVYTEQNYEPKLYNNRKDFMNHYKSIIR